MNLQKPHQDIFYSDPIGNTERAWAKINAENIKPITIGEVDCYLVSYNNSGFAGGMGGQLQNQDYVTIITQAGTNNVMTAYPSGRTPRFPTDYKFKLLEVNYEPRP
jgi:hypothetical protein